MSPSQSSLFKDGVLMNMHKHGNWIGGCGKFFVFSKEKVSKHLCLQKMLKHYLTGKLANSSRTMLLNWNDFGSNSHQGKEDVLGQNYSR
jgi:hypothetical protein